MTYFQYDPQAAAFLKAKDPVLGAAMDKIGPIRRPVNPDLFSSLVNSIVGQQISTKAQQTIWGRMTAAMGRVTPRAVLDLSDEQLQAFGITFLKAGYIKGIARRVSDGALDLESLHEKTDEEVCRALSALPGIGVWTAEMLMTFSMNRQNIMSFGDLAIHRGLRMLYHHRKVDRKLFEKYRRRYDPYASLASLYLWDIAGGAIPEMRDYAPKKPKKKPGKKPEGTV